MTKTATITISHCWEDYFKRHDEGLGTTYERFILHNYFSSLKDCYNIQTVLEAPSFGMTGVSGINSLWWASQGAKVTIVDQSTTRLAAIEKAWQETGLPAEFVFQPPNSAELPFADGAFDLAFSNSVIGACRRVARSS